MDISKLQDVVVDALEDVKGQQIEVFDTTAITDLFDRVVIVSGTSNRQTRALAMSVVEAVRKVGGAIISTEGEETGEWVLVDCGDLIVHIMQPAIRTYYNLEELWGQTAIDVTAEKRSKFARGKSVKATGKVATKGPTKVATKAPTKGAAKVATKVAKKAPEKAATKVATKTAAKLPAKLPTKIAAKAPTKVTKQSAVKDASIDKPAKPTRKAAVKSISVEERPKVARKTPAAKKASKPSA